MHELPPVDPCFRVLFLWGPKLVPAPNISTSPLFVNAWIATVARHMAEPLSVDPTEVWGGVDGSWST